MDITIKNLQNKFPLNKKLIKVLTQRTAQLLNLDDKSEISLVFVNNKIIQKLNSLYLQKDSPTDVLAFSLSKCKIKQNIRLISDIIINLEMANKNAKIYKNSLIKENTLYIIHGILHLLGYNDHKSQDRIRMQKKQEELLAQLFLIT